MQVTNQSDKDVQLPKIYQFDEAVKRLMRSKVSGPAVAPSTAEAATSEDKVVVVTAVAEINDLHSWSANPWSLVRFSEATLQDKCSLPGGLANNTWGMCSLLCGYLVALLAVL